MRAIMGLIKNSHGVYHVRKKVPADLQEPAARILGNGKRRQTWLKRSLGTKELARANVLAKPVLIEFDRVLRSQRPASFERASARSAAIIICARVRTRGRCPGLFAAEGLSSTD